MLNSLQCINFHIPIKEYNEGNAEYWILVLLMFAGKKIYMDGDHEETP